MPEPARLDGSGGSAPDSDQREIFIDGVDRVAKSHDPLVSGHIADDATSGNRLAKDEIQETVSDQGQTESVASNVVRAGDESAREAARNIDGGGSAPSTPGDAGDFGVDATQRATDLDHLSLAPRPSAEAPGDSTDGGTAIEEPVVFDTSLTSDPTAGPVGSIDPPTLIETDPLGDFDWSGRLDDLELPEVSPPMPDNGDLPDFSGPDLLY